MTAIRRDPPFAVPVEGIRTARPVGWMHAFSLALAANALELAGGTVFANTCHLTLTSGEGGGSVTTGTFRHKVPVRGRPTHRLWTLAYADATLAGTVKITPGIAPLNSAEQQWVTGLPIDPPRPSTSRRTPPPLVFWEEIDKTGGGYTAPSDAHDLSYTVTWDPDDGGQDITILSICCYELDLGELTSGSYGVDETVFRPRAAIYSGDASDIDGGVRQLAAIIQRVKSESLHRYLFGEAYPDDDVEYLATSSSHEYTDVFVVNPRIHPARHARTDPGFKVAEFRVRAYGRNSATNQGVLAFETRESSGTLAGFPIGSYGWVEATCSGTAQTYGNRASPTQTGFQDGATLDADTDTQSNETTEDTLTIQIKAKTTVGDSANTFDVITFECEQILP